MSRSFKKHPIFKLQNDSRYKKVARRKVRYTDLEDVPNGGAFKKFFEQYNICDLRGRYTLQEKIVRFRAMYGRDPDDIETKEIINEWEKDCKRK